MKNNLYQEFYKFGRQKSPYWGVAFLLFFMWYTAATTPMSKGLLVQGFGLAQWVIYVLIAVGTTFFAMEDQHRTIILLFFKSKHKRSIYLAKMLVMVVYDVILLLIGMAFTFVLKALMASGKGNWSDIYQYHHSLFASFSIDMLGVFSFTLLMLSIVFLLASAISNTLLAIGIGVLISYFGQPFAGIFMSLGFTSILKWNPLNMMNLTSQLMDHSYIDVTKLSIPQLSLGTAVYVVIFFAWGYVLFKKKKV
jgi:ABC-2 type transport system permease protein